MEITKEIFDQWVGSNPVTVAVFQRRMVQRQALLEELGTGKTLNPQSAEATLAMTAKIIGQIEGLDWLLNFSYDKEEDE